MSTTLKTLGVLAAICVFIWLYLFRSTGSVVSDNALSEMPPQALLEKEVEAPPAQPAPTGQDPFKKFLDQKAGISNTVTKPDNSQAIPVQTGKDPFKEFLDKQKQNSKDQVVSPFGKN